MAGIFAPVLSAVSAQDGGTTWAAGGNDSLAESTHLERGSRGGAAFRAIMYIQACLVSIMWAVRAVTASLLYQGTRFNKNKLFI